MKKRLIQISALSLVALLAGVGSASASNISFSDTFAPTSTLLDGQAGNACTGTNGAVDTVSPGSCKSLVWTFNLAGFNSGTDVLTSATATITTHDNEDTAPPQSFDITLDLLSFSGQDVNDGAAPTIFNYSVLSQIGDGTLVVKITSQNGNHDFFFDNAILNASGTRNGSVGATDIAAVPEPASLGLLGFGLVALAAGARRAGKPAKL